MRSATQPNLEKMEGRPSRRRGTDSDLIPGQDSRADGAGGKRTRRSGKERAVGTQPAHTQSPRAAGPRSLRGASAADLCVVEQRADYRSAKGLSEMREQLGFKDASQHSMSESETSELTTKSKAPEEVAPMPPTRLPGGFTTGERVSSLVSRVRGGLLVLELGNEGAVMGARGVGSDLRLLVQFDRGFDWLLPPSQVCARAKLPSAKAQGLPKFHWGSRVRSLVTCLLPSRAQRSIGLGEAGTVAGPGSTPGKLAVRFDEAGEWSIWPSLLCAAESYHTTVQEQLAGGFCRGDRGHQERQRLQKLRCGAVRRRGGAGRTGSACAAGVRGGRRRRPRP